MKFTFLKNFFNFFRKNREKYLTILFNNAIIYKRRRYGGEVR